MSRTRKIFAGVAAVAAVAITAVLVLEGGGPRRGNFPVVVLTYEVAPVGNQTETQARDQAITGIRERLDDRSLAHASVVPAGASRVRVEIGGKDVPFDRMKEREREAHDLVSVLRAGAIPPLLLIERRDVGPSR